MGIRTFPGTGVVSTGLGMARIETQGLVVRLQVLHMTGSREAEETQT